MHRARNRIGCFSPAQMGMTEIWRGMDGDVVDDDRLSSAQLIKGEEKCGGGREEMSAQLLLLPERG